MASGGGEVDELAPYMIPTVQESKEEKSDDQSGSFGFVYLVKVAGVVRIAKKTHTAFLRKVSVRERSSVITNFRRECLLLSKLRHPNIVQFVGVHYGHGGRDDLALIMEKLSSDLMCFLANNPKLKLSTKLSILLDVSYGLVYLHEYNPPIVHRDLTARNILLTDSCVAKIADVGVSKMMDLHAMQAASHTQNPGQMFYMPPEACEEKAACTTKLDIFSFGHLSLHIVIGDFPVVYEVRITPDLLQKGGVQILRRRRSLEQVGSGHCLYPIITECLTDDPEKRPTTRQVNDKINSLLAESDSRKIPVSVGSDENKELERRDRSTQLALQKQLDVYQHQLVDQCALVTKLGKAKNDLSQELAVRDQQMIALKDEANVINFRNLELLSEISKLKQSESGLFRELSMRDQQMIALQDEACIFNFRNRELLSEISNLKQSKSDVPPDGNQLQEHVKYQCHVIVKLREENASLKVQRLDDENRLFSSCDNPTFKEHSLQKEIEVMRHNIAHLEQERNEAIEKMAVANVRAEIFKSDFEDERRDRSRSQGELEVLRKMVGQTKADQKLLPALQIDIDKIRKEHNKVTTKLAMVESKLKTESCNSKEVIFQLKTENEKLTGERDSYREQCAKIKGIQADVTKSKSATEKCRKKIDLLTQEAHDLKEEKILTSKVIKGLEKQLKFAMTSIVDLMDKLEKCRKEKRELKVAKKKVKKTNKKVKTQINSSPVSTASTESKPSTTETLYQVELLSNQSLHSEIDELKDDLEANKEINEMQKALLRITAPAAADFWDAQKPMVPNTVSNPVGNKDTSYEILSLPSNTTDDQLLSVPDPPTCHVMSHGIQDRDPNFHANPRGVSSTKKVVSGVASVAAPNRGKTSDSLIHDQPLPLTTSDHPQHLLGKNASEAASVYSLPSVPQPSHLPLTVSRSLARQSSVESRPPLEPDSEHNGNHYGASQGNELLQGPPRQGEAIHQEPLRDGGDPHPIPHHDCARRIASYHEMIGPQSLRDRLFAASQGPSQDGTQRRADSLEMIGQQAECHGDRDKYLQPLQAGENDVLLSCQNGEKMLLPCSQEPAASPVMNSLRVHKIRSGEGQMIKLPLLAGWDGISRSFPGSQRRMPNSSTQETYQREYGRLDLKESEDSEGAIARKMYALEKKERNTGVGIPTLHDPEHQSEPQAMVNSTGTGPHPQNYLFSASLDQTSKLLDEVMSDFAERNSNNNILDCSIDSVIENMVEDVKNEVSTDKGRMKTMEIKPFDPNFSCPVCGKVLHIGEIQKFRRHVDMCGN